MRIVFPKLPDHNGITLKITKIKTDSQESHYRLNKSGLGGKELEIYI